MVDGFGAVELVDAWGGADGAGACAGWRGGVGDGAVARRHAGLAAAAAGGGEVRVRERGEMPGPIWESGSLGILTSRDLPFFHFGPPASFLLKMILQH